MDQKLSHPTCCYGSRLNELRLNGELVDMDIVVGSETYRVHQVIMAAKSDYFRAIMSSQLREAKENRVTIEDVDPENMKTVIEFCYTNQLSLNDDNFHQVLSAAFRFCIESLKEFCVEFIGPRITASNCIGLIHSFQQYSLTHLLDNAIGFSLENFDLVCDTPEFSDIEEYVWEILLPDDRLNLSESSVFRALVKWTEHDLENRKAAFERLVKHVRFATIDASELSELSSFELATISESCKELIAKAKNYLEIKRQDKQSESETLAKVSATPRRNLRNCQRMYAIGGYPFVQMGELPLDEPHETLPDFRSVEIYDPNTDKWTEAPMQSQRVYFGCAVLGDDIYIVGGTDGDNSLDTFERYSITNDTWQSLPAMPTARHSLGLVALGEYLYAIGGMDSVFSVDTVERFRPGDTKWHECAPMLNPRDDASYVALDGYIYAIGGESALRKKTTLERYDPRTDSWCSLSPLFQSIQRFESTCCRGMIYIMCCDEGPPPHLQIFVYDPSKDKWLQLLRAPTHLCSVKFVEFHRELYAVGVLTDDSDPTRLESYNPETKQWTAKTGMTSRRTGYSLIVHPQRMFPAKHPLVPLVEQ